MRKAKGRGGLDPRRKKAPPRLSLVASVYWCGSRTQKRLLLGATTTTTAAARATILVFLAGAFAAALQLVGKIFSLPPSAAPENCIFRFERYLSRQPETRFRTLSMHCGLLFDKQLSFDKLKLLLNL